MSALERCESLCLNADDSSTIIVPLRKRIQNLGGCFASHDTASVFVIYTSAGSAKALSRLSAVATLHFTVGANFLKSSNHAQRSKDLGAITSVHALASLCIFAMSSISTRVLPVPGSDMSKSLGFLLSTATLCFWCLNRGCIFINSMLLAEA